MLAQITVGKPYPDWFPIPANTNLILGAMMLMGYPAAFFSAVGIVEIVRGPTELEEDEESEPDDEFTASNGDIAESPAAESAVSHVAAPPRTQAADKPGVGDEIASGTSTSVNDDTAGDDISESP